MPRPPKLLVRDTASELEKLTAARRRQLPGTIPSARKVLDMVEEIEARLERQTRLIPIEKRIAEVTANIARLEGDLAFYKDKRGSALAATTTTTNATNNVNPSSPSSGSGLSASSPPLTISSTTPTPNSLPSSSSSSPSPNPSVLGTGDTGGGKGEAEGDREEMVGRLASTTAVAAVAELEYEPFQAQIAVEGEGDFTSLLLPFDKPAPVIDEWDELVPPSSSSSYANLGSDLDLDLDLLEAEADNLEPEQGLEVHTGTPLPMSEDDLDLFAQPLPDYADADADAAEADANNANREVANEADNLLVAAVDPEPNTTKAKRPGLLRFHVTLPPKS
jgi:hypothetical protein